MKKNTKEKALVQVNENSIFYKIKSYFINLFNKNTTIIDNYTTIEETKKEVDNENEKSVFVEEIRNIENEETKLLKLQKQYRSKKIKEEDMTEEQVKSLCDLYDKQITELRKSNEMRKQRLLEYRKKLQTEG